MKEVDAYVKRRRFLKYNEAEDKYEEFSINCDIKELSYFGAGIQLYFFFLKAFAWLFFILFLVYLIPVYKNFTALYFFF